MARPAISAPVGVSGLPLELHMGSLILRGAGVQQAIAAGGSRLLSEELRVDERAVLAA
jgi:hypothetical protein